MTKRPMTPATLEWMGRRWRNTESTTDPGGKLSRGMWVHGLDQLEAWHGVDGKWSATLHVESGMDAWGDLRASRLGTFKGALTALARIVRRVGKVGS